MHILMGADLKAFVLLNRYLDISEVWMCVFR